MARRRGLPNSRQTGHEQSQPRRWRWLRRLFAWGAALADKPREEDQIADIPADTGPNGYSSGEVVSSGMQFLGGFLNLLGAAAGAYSAGSSYYYSAPPTRNYATPYNSGGGYVYRAPPQRQSTITGGSR